jgi:serine O-acetyltransferase
MIKSKKDYLEYLKADYTVLHDEDYKQLPKWQKIGVSLLGDETWQFQKVLRRVEYIQNCKHGLIGKITLALALMRYHHLSVKLGYHICPNCFGPGLWIAHIGTIIVSPKACIGSHCIIHTGVVIGVSQGGAPRIGKQRLYRAGR